jgi:small-conductance mechanosensitive channel
MADRSREKEVVELKHDENVRRALEETSVKKEPRKKVKLRTGHKLELGTYILLLAGTGFFYYLIRLGYLDFTERFLPLLERASLGMMGILVVIVVSKLVKVYLVIPLTNDVARFNLVRVVNLLTGTAIFFIGLSVLFASWYTAVVSFGLISLILGLALQTPISSFIGWIYILVKSPYKVGDRIKIEEASGDVIDVSYLDTTLWEFGGDDLSTNHPSGRLIKFPNSKVLNTMVFNYSWSLFPYVWNEIRFEVAYQSDLDYVGRVMRETAAEELGDQMMDRVKTFQQLLSETPVDQLEVKEYPSVVFRVTGNTWLEAICRYLVEPRRSGAVKTRLIKKMLARLNEAPDKVMFPRGDAR